MDGVRRELEFKFEFEDGVRGSGHYEPAAVERANGWFLSLPSSGERLHCESIFPSISKIVNELLLILNT
jgi:hypothetical protein